MEEERVPLYPIANIRVQVNAPKAFLTLDLPYFRQLHTDEQARHEHSYALLEEHARYLRDALDGALQQIAEARGQDPG